jgi:hypothetical protein
VGARPTLPSSLRPGIATSSASDEADGNLAPEIDCGATRLGGTVALAVETPQQGNVLGLNARMIREMGLIGPHQCPGGRTDDS